jgi:hypothetical protein
LGVIVAPLAVFAICSVIGLLFCKLLHGDRLLVGNASCLPDLPRPCPPQ